MYLVPAATWQADSGLIILNPCTSEGVRGIRDTGILGNGMPASVQMHLDLQNAFVITKTARLDQENGPLGRENSFF